MSKRHHVAIVAAAGLAALVALTGPTSASETVNYTYDAKGRLVKVEHAGSVNANVVANYTFDKADNRVTVNVSGAP